ncbi:glycoside hydrolase family 2 TIM barrel-domain containing protein [Paenibacillus thermotolerans]|uniref:glycoside hydrolase family 2 TIM barrel-domain containing protein n=1 Tax=Paenibacillus thermotolerans TaxID=3027807 RepID=UPI00236846D6|nr:MULTISPECIES: glycoside hydrolase family 2 TIM barrel-domain containing protein [unclassified Paenibacillus]
MGSKIPFNDNWRFQLETNGPLAGAEQAGYDDSAWRELNVPHDWSIELEFNQGSPATHEGGYLDGGVAWYRKAFTLPRALADKRLSIDFDGVYMDSAVYLNGELLGAYPYGYNGFSIDMSGKAHTDGTENVLAVRVNNTQPSSRWYSGSGIYRNVYLTVRHPVHADRHGVFVTTPDLEADVKKGRAGVHIETKVKNDSGEPASVAVCSVILDEEGTVAATVRSKETTVESGVVGRLSVDAVIEQPRLWSLERPVRYKLVTEVLVNGQTTDVCETPFGLRYFSFDADEGFSLNGRHMKLHGVCMHHDLGALGAAVNARAVERQMQIMKEMGVNAIRVTHNPACDELIEACNRIGLLVVEEAFDTWNISKKEYDYGRFFAAWAEHDIKEMVHRHKNEPSVIMWSIGNEIYDTTGPGGLEIARKLVRWVKEADPTRPTTIGEDKTRGDKVTVTALNEYIEEIFNTVDVVGLNYSENNYQGYHELHPEWKLYGSETSSATRSRGVYTHPYDYNMSKTYADAQQSSYDNDYVAWGRTAEDAWKRERDLKHIAGQFIWTGFDYIGEPTPYYNAFPSKSSYFGAVDTAGFPKDIYYYYQSQWSDKPMVRLLPHWNWSEGETVRVLVYTNARKAELLLNGESLGERSFEAKRTSWGAPYLETEDGKTYLEWAVPFRPGTLMAVAKDENGAVVGTDLAETAGAPAAVRLTADRSTVLADGKDLAFVTAEIVDAAGRVVPTAGHLIRFEAEGCGELAGVDNGDAASVEPYKANRRKAFHGKALAIVQALRQPGEIVLRASSEGLAGDAIRIGSAAPARSAKLIAAELTVSHDSLLAGESVELAVTGMLDSGELVRLPGASAVYRYDGELLRIGGGTLAALREGDARVSATVTYEGVTVETPELRLRIWSASAVKTVVAFDAVRVVVNKGEAPKLPAAVQVRFNAGAPEDRAVLWDTVDEALLERPGAFTVRGDVEGTGAQAEALVIVKGAIAIEKVSAAVLSKQRPALPETVTVYFSDGTEQKRPVRWEAVAAEAELRPGSVLRVAGTIEGGELAAEAVVRVTDEVGIAHNISRAKNGYDYPKAEASYTCADPGSEDTVAAIHDDVISYGEHPHNRWSNLHDVPRLNDWVAVTFGDFGPVEHEVDEVEIHWVENGRLSPPSGVSVQYRSGDEWKPVDGLSGNPEVPAAGQPCMYTFERVRTSAIRVDMTAKPGKGIAVTELKVFDKRAKAYGEPNVADITLGGRSILHSFQKVSAGYECVVTLDVPGEPPALDAIGGEHAAVTVVPPVPAAGGRMKARVIARSEDGKKTAVYAVIFE